MDEVEIKTRFMREHKKGFNNGFWFGLIFGFVTGGLGGYILAEHTIERTLIIPLGEGTKL